MLRIDQTPQIINGIAYDDKIRIQQRVVLGSGGVIEFEPVVVLSACAHIVDEWLIEIAEETRREWDGVLLGVIVVVATTGSG